MQQPSRLRTIFAGTPAFALPSLETLLADPRIDLIAVYTQPDRPAGRGRRLAMSPIKARARAADIPVHQPASLRDAEAAARFAALAPTLLVVAAYGLILPAAVLAAARYSINVHASLLPRWRGAAPIQHAILAGDVESGISIMRVVERLDAGPVWLRLACPIAPDDTGGSLHDKLAGLGGTALRAALDQLCAGTVHEQPQEEDLATYAPKITAADRALDWRAPATALARRVRALAPVPGAHGRVGALEVKILAATALATDPGAAPPGSILARAATGIDIATGAGVLRLTALQPPGKQRLSAAAFLNGYGAQL